MNESQPSERESLRSALQALVKIANALPGASLNGELLAACNIAYAALSAPASSEASDAVPDDTKVICPGCAHQFRAIPVQVQGLLLASGHEPPFLTPPAEAARQPLTGPILGDEWIDRQWIESCQQTYFPALTHYTAAVERAIKDGITGAQE